MTLLIHDANVLIDLISIDLLDLALDLPFRMATTDLVRQEIEDTDQIRALESCINSGKLDIITSSFEEIKAIASVMEKCNRLSLADCSVLYHATELDSIVISGDAKLRKEATTRHVVVHGTPWIMSMLADTKDINLPIIIAGMEQLLGINPRLPYKECQKLLENWKIRLSNEEQCPQ